MKNPSRFIIAVVAAGAIFVLALLVPESVNAWGGSVHKLLNRAATWHLPPSFQGFSIWVDDLETLSTAADERKCCVDGERIKHYIDIDDYPEFFSGTLPHSWDDIVARYGLSRVEGNGTVPWAIEDSYAALVTLFEAEDWEEAVSVAADIGHYAGDLHNPLHLTVNYNGQLTGQYGVHSRYESGMTNRHLGELEPAHGMATDLTDPLESMFSWIDDQYPGVELILSADRVATEATGNTSSEVYYTALWDEVGFETQKWLTAASLAIASLWYSAWVDAGSPTLPGSAPVSSTTWGRIKSLYITE